MANLPVGIKRMPVCGNRQYWDNCFFFLIYNKDLPQGLNSEIKLFADDISLFRSVNCVNASASTLNSDLLKIRDLACQWKCHSIQIEHT